MQPQITLDLISKTSIISNQINATHDLRPTYTNWRKYVNISLLYLFPQDIHLQIAKFCLSCELCTYLTALSHISVHFIGSFVCGRYVSWIKKKSYFFSVDLLDQLRLLHGAAVAAFIKTIFW
jgi:hypothetical protein